LIEGKELFGLNHYRYGEAFFGSYRGMRYRLASDPFKRLRPDESAEGMGLVATVWPEPWSYASTDPSLMISEHFDFTKEGYEQAVAWLNEQYDKDPERWKAASETDLTA